MDLLGLGNLALGIIDKVVPDPQKKAEALLELEKLKQNGELAKIASETELFKAEVDDRKSAREREVKVNEAETAPYINKIITSVLSLVILSCTFGLYAVLILDDGEISQERKEIIIFITGALTTLSTGVIQYYFGSSSGSKEKSDSINFLMRK